MAPAEPGFLVHTQKYDSIPSAQALALYLYCLLSQGLTV